MTLAHLWPLLIVSGLGLILVVLAVIMNGRTNEDGDGGYLVWVTGLIGLFLLATSADHIVSLTGKK